MYREIGDVFTMVDSDTSKVVELQVVKERYGLVCEECYFYKEYEYCVPYTNSQCRAQVGHCSFHYREDHTDVIFKLLKEHKNFNKVIPINIT